MRILRITILVIASMLIITGVFMMINGSLEMYPTCEQQEKVHLTGAVLTLIGGIISIVTYFMQRKGK